MLLRFTLVQRLIAWSKANSIPGFSNIAIYDILAFVVGEVQKDNLTTRANSIAFSFLLSIFPAIIFLFTLLPYMPITGDFTQVLLNSLVNIMPKNAHDYLSNIINDITKIKRQGLLSIGFLLTLYFSSSGMLTLMAGFDKSYRASFSRRRFYYKRLIAINLTLLLGLLMVFSIFSIIVGDLIFNNINEKYHLPFSMSLIITFFRWCITILLVYSGISIIYRFGPSLRKKLPMLNPGSVLATILSILSSILFAYFVNNFGKYNELYGSIGALIVIMVWLQINAFILLLGFELNASIAVNRDLKNFGGKVFKIKIKKNPQNEN